ncbi:MAG: hypothetical protein WCP36_01965, partial [Methanomicrobiales archaeon]
ILRLKEFQRLDFFTADCRVLTADHHIQLGHTSTPPPCRSGNNIPSSFSSIQERFYCSITTIPAYYHFIYPACELQITMKKDYAKPELIDLNESTGRGGPADPCQNGSGAAGFCNSGITPGFTCGTGTSPNNVG